MYASGRGVLEDDAEAVRWYRLAAEQGLASAQLNLGVMYANGEGVLKDNAEAARWFRQAAEQGLTEAQYNLGVMYDNGQGVPEDDAEAVKWYRRAAEQGNAEAQLGLGILYEQGWGVLVVLQEVCHDLVRCSCWPPLTDRKISRRHYRDLPASDLFKACAEGELEGEEQMKKKPPTTTNEQFLRSFAEGLTDCPCAWRQPDKNKAGKPCPDCG